MKRAMTSTQCVEAKALAEGGKTLEQIRAKLGLKCSRQSVWRAVRSVTTAEERIASYRRTGIYDALDVGEMLIALEPERGTADADADKK